MTEDLLKSFNIQFVVDESPRFQELLPSLATVDNSKLAKEKGIYSTIKIENVLTIDTIVERIMANRDKYFELTL